MSMRPGFVAPQPVGKKPTMPHGYQQLYLIATAILVIGLVVGLAFTGVSATAVVVGVLVLGCLAVALFMVGRRDKSDQHSDDYVYDFTPTPHDDD